MRYGACKAVSLLYVSITHLASSFGRTVGDVNVFGFSSYSRYFDIDTREDRSTASPAVERSSRPSAFVPTVVFVTFYTCN